MRMLRDPKDDLRTWNVKRNNGMIRQLQHGQSIVGHNQDVIEKDNPIVGMRRDVMDKDNDVFESIRLCCEFDVLSDWMYGWPKSIRLHIIIRWMAKS